MLTLNFSGSTSLQLPWQNETIPTGSNLCSSTEPPPQIGLGSLKNITVNDKSITWNSPVPSSLTGISVNGINALITSGNLQNATLTSSLVFNITNGSQRSQGIPKMVMYLYQQGDGPTSPGFPTENFDSFVLTSPGINTSSGPNYSWIGANETLTYQTSNNLGGLQAIPFDDTNAPIPLCFDATNMTITLQLNVTVKIICNDSDLETGFCPNYCMVNTTTCFQTYYNHCLVQTDSAGDLNIFGSTGCQTFFADFIAANGPRKEIDNLLTPACIKKFPTFASLLASNKNNIDLCACHLDQSLYDNLRKQIIVAFPGFAAVDENERCLFPQCADSPFPTIDIGPKCLLPNCININSINNDGTINGPVTINQNDQGCVDASQGKPVNGGGNGGNTSSKTWLENYWLWLVLGIGLLVILIIVILIIIAAEKHKPVPKYKPVI